MTLQFPSSLTFIVFQPFVLVLWPPLFWFTLTCFCGPKWPKCLIADMRFVSLFPVFMPSQWYPTHHHHTHTHTNIHTLLFPLITNPDLYQQSPSVLLPGVVSYCLFSSCVLASQLQMTPVFPDNSDILPYILFVKAMSHQQCYISQSCCFIYKILMLSLQEKQG